MCFFYTSAFFLFGRESFLVLSAPGHAGRPPEHHGASVGPGRAPWHVLWGFKVASDHLGSIPSTWSHLGACKLTDRLKKCPTAHVISRILNVVNAVRHSLVMVRYFPDTDLRYMRPLLVQ